MIFLCLRLDTFFNLLDILFFHYSALLAFISPYSFFVFRFNFILPDKQCQYPSATRRANNVYAFLTVSKPPNAWFLTYHPSRDLDLICRKAVFPAHSAPPQTAAPSCLFSITRPPLRVAYRPISRTPLYMPYATPIKPRSAFSKHMLPFQADSLPPTQTI